MKMWIAFPVILTYNIIRNWEGPFSMIINYKRNCWIRMVRFGLRFINMFMWTSLIMIFTIFLKNYKTRIYCNSHFFQKPLTVVIHAIHKYMINCVVNKPMSSVQTHFILDQILKKKKLFLLENRMLCSISFPYFSQLYIRFWCFIG